MNITNIKQAAEIAKSRTSDKRWVAAINKAVAGVEGGWIVTELHHGIMVTTENGTYHANGSCQCKAFTLGQACKHRALARLIEIANNEVATPATSRADIIADIKRAWPHNEFNLTDELMKRFKRNSLEMLSVDFLQAIHAAI